MDEKTTRELMNILNRADTPARLETYLEELPAHMPPQTFSEYFLSLPEVQALPRVDIVKASGLERTYCYQILNGTRAPGRDKVIALGLAAGLSLAKIRRALEICSLGILYSRNRRDAILIFSVNRGITVQETQELLVEFGEKPLEL